MSSIFINKGVEMMESEKSGGMDRYVTFERIDCFKNAHEVVSNALRVLEANPEMKNPFWEKFCSKIPDSFYSYTPQEDLLYLVCANVFYLEELFDEAEDEEGQAIMSRCEFECC
ncbi:hypothetical protein WS1017 [Wolinella succinogenes]|uniref:N(2)-fixation sustaining protein CowN n=2 Tax=Wolinella succinogenes TaxID=844 RepID=COWN_WOLSU|nr:RecName: Full=N(2)-fixation sustaining protein CowN; AltName: Full=CO weal-nitrogenase [Wolinella succinogenes DSM 1740]NLU34285.1 N(2)-fixation sustaining protein CowN [Wolinella succinogenes]CAE10119.1 hypothetical protein WS1017 [Wolinella succinogenes]HCZ19015.1 N(2)-fixation sustaining protein CowN [Helicobacter sp.]